MIIACLFKIKLYFWLLFGHSKIKCYRFLIHNYTMLHIHHPYQFCFYPIQLVYIILFIFWSIFANCVTYTIFLIFFLIYCLACLYYFLDFGYCRNAKSHDQISNHMLEMILHPLSNSPSTKYEPFFVFVFVVAV